MNQFMLFVSKIRGGACQSKVLRGVTRVSVDPSFLYKNTCISTCIYNIRQYMRIHDCKA